MALTIPAVRAAFTTVRLAGRAIGIVVTSVALLYVIAFPIPTDDRAYATIRRAELTLFTCVAGAVTAEGHTLTAVGLTGVAVFAGPRATDAIATAACAVLATGDTVLIVIADAVAAASAICATINKRFIGTRGVPGSCATP
jgi:hypothetical protein